MWPPTLRIAPREYRIGSIQKDYLGLDAIAFEFVEDLGPPRKKDAFTGVDAKCNSRNRRILLTAPI